MGNYKPYGHLSSTIGGVTQQLPAGARLICITNEAMSTTGTTFHKVTTNTDKQVTSGKKFVILGCYVRIGTISRIITIFQSDAADGTTGEVTKMIFLVGKSLGDDDFEISIGSEDSVGREISSLKYINMKVNSATNAPKHVILYGYEVDE